MKYLGGAADVGELRRRYARERRARKFLLREPPEGLNLTDPHTQIFDNFITATSLRLRKVRFPATREWSWELMQKFVPDPADFSRTLVTSVYLSQYEYEVLSVFEGNELRKNRYAFEHAGRAYAVDIYLGALRGLVLAGTEFETDEELSEFVMPNFAALEVTNEEFFSGARLVELTAEDIRRELARR